MRIRNSVTRARQSSLTAAVEEDLLHMWDIQRDSSGALRLNLVLPNIEPEYVFGGVATGLQIFLRLGRLLNAELRIILDQITFKKYLDRSVVDRMAIQAGFVPSDITILDRRVRTPPVPVRGRDIFIAYNWWAAANIKSLLEAQTEISGGVALPYIYLCQEFEPGFYPFSSTHHLAWSVMVGNARCWTIFNSANLAKFCGAMGAEPGRSFILEPRISDSLRPFLAQSAMSKARQILVYGRPFIPRNCWPALLEGLKLWAESSNGQHWKVLSAGSDHKAMALGGGHVLQPLGKLSLAEYARVLSESSIGVSLMCSPHPSYPPLEMAHFGLITLTNKYAFKDLTGEHPNIRNVADLFPQSISKALSDACNDIDHDPDFGIRNLKHNGRYTDQNGLEFLNELARDLLLVAKGQG